MKFKDYITEGKLQTIYHGDNFNTKKLIPKLMMQESGNSQEGVGIYFSNKIETAESYGKDVISINVDTKKLIPSRGYIGDEIGIKNIAKILRDMYKIDEEEMYYYISDWLEIMEPEDIRDYHFDKMAKNIKDTQVRNFQIDISEKFGVVHFVESWNKVTRIDGTYEKVSQDETWYAIINPYIKVKSINII